MTSLDYNLYEPFSTGPPDCSQNTTDSYGNTVDCQGNIIYDPNNIDSSGNELDSSSNDIDSSGNELHSSSNDIDSSGNTTNTITVKNENDDNSLEVILSYENLYILFWIVSIYFIIYSLLAFFFRSDNLGYVYNVIILLTIFGIIVAYYIMTDTDEYKDDAENSVDRFLSFFDNKFNIIYLIAGIIFLYIITSIIRVPTNKEDRPTIIIGLETLLMILLVLVLFVQFFKEFSDISLTDELRERLGIIPSKSSSDVVITTPRPRPTPTPTPTAPTNKEVFNVGGNHYTYSDAEAICKSFDAELADYEQIEQSYNNGGEWCNYGWSKNQMALFPTQKKTWTKLQEKELTKNNCGRPGINGGYMANPALRFGVNCYGVKPDKRETDLNSVGDTPYTTPDDKLMQSKIQFWKDNKDKLKLNHYNNNDWSRY